MLQSVRRLIAANTDLPDDFGGIVEAKGSCVLSASGNGIAGKVRDFLYRDANLFYKASKEALG
jgi:hypothetical protein